MAFQAMVSVGAIGPMTALSSVQLADTIGFRPLEYSRKLAVFLASGDISQSG
jgi:hypothetical protein